MTACVATEMVLFRIVSLCMQGAPGYSGHPGPKGVRGHRVSIPSGCLYFLYKS